jgi:hypothetical protein
MFTPWRVKQLARESEWNAVLKVRAPQSGPRGTGFIGEALSGSARLSPRERTQSKQERNTGRTMNAACTALGLSTSESEQRLVQMQRADPLAEWIGPRPAADAIRAADSPGMDARSTWDFDSNAARVLARSPSRKFGVRRLLLSARPVALKPVAIIGLDCALHEPPAPLDAAVHVSIEARRVWLTHTVAVLAKSGIVIAQCVPSSGNGTRLSVAQRRRPTGVRRKHDGDHQRQA